MYLRLGGILLSSVATWHLLLTGSEFGIHKRKALRQDIVSLPMPSRDILLSDQAAPISHAMESIIQNDCYGEPDLEQLDTAVFDAYELEPHERLVVLDGMARAQREYVQSRYESDVATTEEQLQLYAGAFLSVINAWQMALGRERYSAEVLVLRSTSPLRVIRFFDGGNGNVTRGDFNAELNDILQQIGSRIRSPIAEHLAAVRELRVHAENELLIIKPAARRFWTAAAGLNDADSALGDGLEAAVE